MELLHFNVELSVFLASSQVVVIAKLANQTEDKWD